MIFFYLHIIQVTKSIMNKYKHARALNTSPQIELSAKCSNFKKYYFNMGFTHLGLVFLISFAIFGGGFLFQTLERHASVQKW